VAHAVAGAGRFGVMAGPATIDGRAVMARVRSERDRFVGFVVDAVQRWPAEHRLQGHARFVDDHTLQVAATQVRRRSASSSPPDRAPPCPGLARGAG
jgi:dihydrolipoamide dehydrogenase